jgi:hypothetical protein
MLILKGNKKEDKKQCEGKQEYSKTEEAEE